MPKLNLTPKQIDFIKANRLIMSGSDMAVKFGIRKDSVNSFMRKHNLTPPRELIIKFIAKSHEKPFTKRENNFIIKNIEHKSIKEISSHLKRTSKYIGKQARELGLGNILDEKAKDSHFKKGRTSENKGKSMSAEMYERCKYTMFKKGHLSHNEKPLYTENKRKDKNGNIYTYIKIPAHKKFVLKHKYIFEQNYGGVPKGFNVVFINKNKNDFRIENLECISDAELMKRNTIHNYPIEIKTSIRLLTKLTKKIRHAKSNN